MCRSCGCEGRGGPRAPGPSGCARSPALARAIRGPSAVRPLRSDARTRPTDNKKQSDPEQGVGAGDVQRLLQTRTITTDPFREQVRSSWTLRVLIATDPVRAITRPWYQSSAKVSVIQQRHRDAIDQCFVCAPLISWSAARHAMPIAETVIRATWASATSASALPCRSDDRGRRGW